SARGATRPHGRAGRDRRRDRVPRVRRGAPGHRPDPPRERRLVPRLMAFPHVFSPFRIGGVELRNRIFVPAHTTNYGVHHPPSERHARYHAERARGGAGLIIFEAIRVHPTSIGRAQGVIGYDPRCVPAFRRVADAVHEHGARLFGQIVHVGRHAEGHFGRTA